MERLNMNEHIKVTGDIVAGGVVLANVAVNPFELITILLAIPAAVYACLRIFEWFEKRRKQ